MKVKLWGTRGSLAAPGAETMRYGGNTACVQVRGDDGTILVLDAGTGIRRLGENLPRDTKRVDILLTHLHLDHIQGLGFFWPLETPNLEVHIWGPSSTTQDLRTRLTRYLSPPLFPVRLRDLPCKLFFHETPCDECCIGEFTVQSAMVAHPGPTVGYRIHNFAGVLAYIPDHEPALGAQKFPTQPAWTSGFALAADADLLIHDAQYTRAEYLERIGWGHSSYEQFVQFARLARVKTLVSFHHDPGHTDEMLDRLTEQAARSAAPAVKMVAGLEGAEFEI
ncbi:MAG: MBL fold metallo-hydrolase [Chloroflexi bacterium]|nr:MBL fold metallo-hydrolase [Chloroflexota bacterium]